MKKYIIISCIIVLCFLAFSENINTVWIRKTAVNLDDVLKDYPEWYMDASTAIKKGVLLASTQPFWKARVLFLPPGNFQLNDTLIVPENISIYGSGPEETFLNVSTPHQAGINKGYLTFSFGPHIF